ncbi:OFA family MFS transporter [uncultured Adlercreutzia sp.]|nr:OFA family MFS transporter [uncultured Adlercreutzia sp.]MCI9261101.1 OFA family MFS transporter [Eggerthellaceae bacterium]
MGVDGQEQRFVAARRSASTLEAPAGPSPAAPQLSETQRAALTSRRWVILAASCLVNLCIGALYAWSVFANPMAEHLAALSGGEPPNLSLVFTVACVLPPVTMILGGIVNDRMGPRWVVLAGGLFFGGGLLLSGFATSLPFLMVSFGVCCGLGDGLAYGATLSNAVKFFPDRAGLAGGIITASYGISSVIVPFVANGLISAFSVTDCFRMLGVVMLVVMVGAAFLIAPCPPGFTPTGWHPQRQADGGGRGVNKDWRGMLKSPVFYTMFAMLVCGSFSGLMIISSASPLAQNAVGFDAAQAAAIVSVLALFNTLGRIVSGTLSDKLGIVNTLRAVAVGFAVGMGALSVAGPASAPLFCVGICLVGFCFGSIMGVYPGFAALQFGSLHNSVNYGIMFIAFAAAGVVGPLMLNGLYESTGTYQAAFLVAACLAAAQLVLTFVYRLQNDARRARRRRRWLVAAKHPHRTYHFMREARHRRHRA